MILEERSIIDSTIKLMEILQQVNFDGGGDNNENNNNYDVMVLFYTPTCLYCKGLLIKYEKLAKIIFLIFSKMQK